jgi:apoptosis-inducing factor 2
MGLQIGKKAGTGHYGSIRIPSFLIVWVRKTLLVEKLGPMVDGSLFG